MSDGEPELEDLFRLAKQLEADGGRSLEELRRRDHEVLGKAVDGSDSERLLLWLNAVAPTEASPLAVGGAALAARAVAALMGFSAMAGFLFANGRGLVNVFALLIFFVALQFFLSLISAVVLVRSLRGHVPTRLPMHPARWLARRRVPDARYLREVKPVLHLILLRYGQEWGALFTAAATIAFVAVPAVNEFGFIWGSTFDLGVDFVSTITNALALPWSAWLPAATLEPNVLADSRFHPAVTDLNSLEIEGMRGWWPFLFLCLLTYGFVPRLLLLLGSRYAYRRQLRRSFVGFPGAALVLARLAAPLVSTQGDVDEDALDPGDLQAGSRRETQIPEDPDGLMIDWGATLSDLDPDVFDVLQPIASHNRISLGSASLSDDRERVADLAAQEFRRLALIVKSWEPPMADLADLLEPLARIAHCTVYLLPLGTDEVPKQRVDDWQAFARALPFPAVDVYTLPSREAP
ncbi:MAG: DUF2868 domain-containing protein [Pseudomonadota bacterium]